MTLRYHFICTNVSYAPMYLMHQTDSWHIALPITIAGSYPDDTEYFRMYILIIADSYRLIPEAYPSIT